jgi:hypothetical protein
MVKRSVTAAVLILAMVSALPAENGAGDAYHVPDYRFNIVNIRNTKGKFYAFIVLLFNENPHFVNLIQENSIPLQTMQKEGFHVVEYRNYLGSLKEEDVKTLATRMFDVYLYPDRFSEAKLKHIEKSLERHNIILRFSPDSSAVTPRVNLDYCIYGQKKLVNITHPLFNIRERIYNIQPFIYYDEFTTSNSTFYFDMIYINPEEVENDYVIAKNVLQGRSVESMFFVGSRVTEDIKYCLLRAFNNIGMIKNAIWRMFEIHELTHKILSNHYNYVDQVTGEELALLSTVYSNPYLGLSVLFSYLDYNVTNPHRNAAMNIIRYIARETRKQNLTDNPSMIKYLPSEDLVRLSRDRFNNVLRSLR